MITQDMETGQRLRNVNTERRGRGKGAKKHQKNFFKLITTPPNNQI